MRLARTAPSDLMADKGNSFRPVTYVILALNFPHSMFCCIKLSLSLVIASYVRVHVVNVFISVVAYPLSHPS